MEDFHEIPIIDWSLSKTDKPLFLKQLRDAMINVGFLYLKNHTVPGELLDEVIDYVPKFFDLPQEAKDAVDMSNCAHFHGYMKVGGTVVREHFNFGGERECRYKEGEPEYLKLHGPALWPEEKLLPGFRETMLKYYDMLEDLSYEFTEAVAESLGLPREALTPFFGPDRKKCQPRCKLLYYPPSPPGTTDIVGHKAHTDRSFLTYLLQASDTPGLEVQNLAGEWIAAPPIKHTFVVNLGISLEKASHRTVIATNHRVLAPIGRPRYSIPFFSSLALDVTLADIQLPSFPEEVMAMKHLRDERTGDKGEFEYSKNDHRIAGLNVLDSKLKFHALTTQRFYPNLFDKYFPNGLPANAGTGHYY